MIDNVSKNSRSRIMGRVKSRDNRSTERAFVSFLKSSKVSGWRRHYDAFGTPDFVFPKSRLAIFIDGCFWHGCPSHCRMPNSNILYWNKKIKKNRIRDKAAVYKLKQNGWRVIRIWEHSLTEEKIVPKIKNIKELL